MAEMSAVATAPPAQAVPAQQAQSASHDPPQSRSSAAQLHAWGFTPAQLKVLRAQIMAFRKIKYAKKPEDRHLSVVDLQAVKPPSLDQQSTCCTVLGAKLGGGRRGPAAWKDLPHNIAEDIVERAFVVNGEDVAAWCRLYLVCKDWARYMKDLLADACLQRFLTERDIECLRSTRVRLWRIEFATRDGIPDPASAMLLTDREALPASLETLEEAWRVSMADTAHTLSLYRAFTTIFLMQPDPHFNNAAVLATLPASLLELTLVTFAPVKGAYLAHLTQLRTLCLLLEGVQRAAIDLLSHTDYTCWRLDAYPALLRDLEVVLGNEVEVVLRSFAKPSEHMRMVFRTVDSIRRCSLVLTDAAGLLTGHDIEIGVHSLEVQMHHGADVNCPVSCFLDWVARSRAQSVTLQPPMQHGFGRAMDLKASIATDLGYHSAEDRVLEHQLHADLSRLCGRFGLQCTKVSCNGAVVLRQAPA